MEIQAVNFISEAEVDKILPLTARPPRQSATLLHSVARTLLELVCDIDVEWI